MSFLSLVGHRKADEEVAIAALAIMAYENLVQTNIGINKFVYRGKNILMALYVVQSVWSVLFHPW